MIEVHVNHGESAGVGYGAVRRAVIGVLSGGGALRAEVSVTFLPDHEMQGLNKSYLGHDWPTDVLSFVLSGGDGPSGEPGRDSGLVGDVYIGADRLREQATERGISMEEEGVRLAVHGAMHLLGKDHPEGPEREESEFFAEQEAWVSKILAEEADG